MANPPHCATKNREHIPLVPANLIEFSYAYVELSAARKKIHKPTQLNEQPSKIFEIDNMREKGLMHRGDGGVNTETKLSNIFSSFQYHLELPGAFSL